MNSSKVVLITNVGQGFGRAIALSYGQAGYHVVCADQDVDQAAKTAAEIEESSGAAIPIKADMTTQIDVQNAYNKVLELYGELTGVVHVATRESRTAFHNLSEAEFAELVTENLRSTFLTLKMAERLLENAWIVLVSPPKNASEPHMLSIRGGITRMAAGFEAGNEGMRVNVVVPSRSASDPRHDAQLVQSVRFLGSAEAEGISGHRLYIDLPPPPRIIESLLPEVQAALDSNVRQDDLEAELEDEFSYDLQLDGSVADTDYEGEDANDFEDEEQTQIDYFTESDNFFSGPDETNFEDETATIEANILRDEELI